MTGEARARRGYALALALVVVAIVAPLCAVDAPPLSDFPDHVARVHVLTHLGDPLLARAYEARWGPYPSLAFDAWGLCVAPIVGATWAGKSFLMLTVALWVVAVARLGRAIEGRPSWRALVPACFVVHEPFLLGYATFSFGAGLAVLALSFVIDDARAPSRRSLGLATLLGALALAAHAAAFVSFGLAVAGLAAAGLVASRAANRLPPAATVAEALPLGRAVIVVAPGALGLVGWLLSYAHRAEGAGFAPLGAAVRALFGSVIVSYEGSVDLVVTLALGLVAVASLVRPGERTVRLPIALAVGALAAAVLFAPADVAGGYETNGRYAVLAWALAPFAIDVRAVGKARGGALIGLALGALAARQVVVGAGWLALDAEVRRMRVVLAQLEPGARLGGLAWMPVAAPSRAERVRALALLHVPSLAVIDRSAHVAELYAIPGVQPIAHRVVLPSEHRFEIDDMGPRDLGAVARALDAVWVCHASNDTWRALEGLGAQRVGGTDGCTLARFSRATPP